MKTFIISTSSAEHLAKKLQKTERKNNIKVIFPGKNKNGRRYFPDSEVYVKIPNANKFKGGKVLVLYSGSPNPNKGLVELELILQILKEKGIKPEIFFTYFPYGQQDKVFAEGETNAAENLIKKLIYYYGVKKIYGIDLHFEGRAWTKKYPIINVSAVPLLIKKAQKDFGKNILFLSPDKGGERRTGILAIKKERMDSFNVKIFSPKINVRNKIVWVVDDIIETGGTLMKFYEVVKKAGAKKIIVLATHGVIFKGVKRIKKHFDKLYLTNTINQRRANVDISELILRSTSKKQRF